MESPGERAARDTAIKLMVAARELFDTMCVANMSSGLYEFVGIFACISLYGLILHYGTHLFFTSQLHRRDSDWCGCVFPFAVWFYQAGYDWSARCSPFGNAKTWPRKLQYVRINQRLPVFGTFNLNLHVVLVRYRVVLDTHVIWCWSVMLIKANRNLFQSCWKICSGWMLRLYLPPFQCCMSR